MSSKVIRSLDRELSIVASEASIANKQVTHQVAAISGQ